MANSDILFNEGDLEFWWNSEDHSPPHFHVSTVEGDWEIRVFFPKCDPDKLVYEFKFPSSRVLRIASAQEQKILAKMKTKMDL